MTTPQTPSLEDYTKNAIERFFAKFPQLYGTLYAEFLRTLLTEFLEEVEGYVKPAVKKEVTSSSSECICMDGKDECECWLKSDGYNQCRYEVSDRFRAYRGESV